MGLKRSEIKQVITLAPQGELIQLSVTGGAQRGGGRRGDVSGFSASSRSRLMKRLSVLNKNYLPLFVTLTYPDDFPTGYKIYKYHLHHFLEVLRYHFPECGVIWKLEYQERGAAHYHMLLWGVSLEDARAKVPEIWYNVVKSGDIRHLKFHQGLFGNGNEHCVQAVRSWRGVKSYASKYMSKLVPSDEQGRTGRFWGQVGNVPLSKLLQFRVSMRVALQYRRMIARYAHYKMTNRGLGFWVARFSPDWLRAIDILAADEEESNVPPNFPPQWWKLPYYQEDITGESLPF